MLALRGGAHLPIAHALCLPEQTKKPKSEVCVPPEKRKKKRKRRRKNNAKFSGLYVQPRTHKVGAHAVRSHQFSTIN